MSERYRCRCSMCKYRLANSLSSIPRSCRERQQFVEGVVSSRDVGEFPRLRNGRYLGSAQLYRQRPECVTHLSVLARDLESWQAVLFFLFNLFYLAHPQNHFHLGISLPRQIFRREERVTFSIVIVRVVELDRGIPFLRGASDQFVKPEFPESFRWNEADRCRSEDELTGDRAMKGKVGIRRLVYRCRSRR